MSICATAMVLSIKNNEATPAFVAVAGLRSRSITLNSETVDVTNAGSTNKWRELLDGCGVKSASMSGSGVAKDDTALEEIREAFFAGSHRDWSILIPTFGTLAGKFAITQLQLGGEYNDSVGVDISLESAGELTFTAA